jgi:hypothetical protein
VTIRLACHSDYSNSQMFLEILRILLQDFCSAAFMSWYTSLGPGPRSKLIQGTRIVLRARSLTHASTASSSQAMEVDVRASKSSSNLLIQSQDTFEAWQPIRCEQEILSLCLAGKGIRRSYVALHTHEYLRRDDQIAGAVPSWFVPGTQSLRRP